MLQECLRNVVRMRLRCFRTLRECLWNACGMHLNTLGKLLVRLGKVVGCDCTAFGCFCNALKFWLDEYWHVIESSLGCSWIAFGEIQDSWLDGEIKRTCFVI